MKTYIRLLFSLIISSQIGYTLPDYIYIKNNTQTFNPEYYYCLDGGKIFSKRNKETCTNESEWSMIGTNGLPFSTNGTPLHQPKSIISISADDAILVAISDDYYLYKCDNGIWTEMWGLPFLPIADRIKVTNRFKSLTVSKRYSRVNYYEDAFSNQFNYGTAGCTGAFILSSDGTKLNWSDPWFPPDLSREFPLPNRGKFVVEGISMSASTAMVINKNGDIYTSIRDYDMDGGTPFFDYKYKSKVPIHGIPGTNTNSGTQTHGLPLNDWKLEPRIDGIITKNITILQTGQGNYARELRVQGQLKGECGYFYKNLNDTKWKFKVVPDLTFFIRDVVGTGDKENITNNNDMSFNGKITYSKYGSDDSLWNSVSIKISNLNLHYSPWVFQVYLGNVYVTDILIYTVDAWTLFKQNDPEIDINEVKHLKGTIELVPPRVELKHLDFLKEYDLTSFSLAIVANKFYAEMRESKSDKFVIKLYRQSNETQNEWYKFDSQVRKNIVENNIDSEGKLRNIYFDSVYQDKCFTLFLMSIAGIFIMMNQNDPLSSHFPSISKSIQMGNDLKINQVNSNYNEALKIYREMK